MIRTSHGKLAVLLCTAALVGVSACSKNADMGNKSAAPPSPIPPALSPPTVRGTSPAKQAAATAAGSKAETDEYVVEIIAPGDVVAGNAAEFQVVIKPKAHWKFNLDFPTSVTAGTTTGLRIANPVQKLTDATLKSEKGGAQWAVGVTPAAAGEGTLTCDVKFAVCTDTTCDPKKETLAVKVVAK